MTLTAAPEPAVPTAPTLRRKRLGWSTYLAVAWLGVVVFSAVAAAVLPIADPAMPEPRIRLEGPSVDHWLGTDALGRDVFARLVHGSRVSVTIGLAAVAVGMLVGGTLGIVAGYFRGWVERVVMTCIDILLAFPPLVLLLVVLAFVGRSLPVITLVVGLVSIPIYTRVARANTLVVAEREFVRSSRTLGARNSRILIRDILPNVVGPLMAFALVAMGLVIVAEGTLAFLGLSVAPPDPTWGGMIYEGKGHLAHAPHFTLFPSITMFLTVLSLNFVGDSMRSRHAIRGSNL